MSETAVLPDPDALPGTLRAILPHFDQIAGWLKEDEAAELFRVATAVRTGCIVEVGSYRGRSTLVLCAGSSVGGQLPVYAIDPHEEAVGVFGGRFGPKDRAVFFRNFLKSGLVQHVRLINTTSVAAASGWELPVSLLFIDGDHRFASVDADFTAWQPHLSPDAIVAFYDVGSGGPRRVSEMLVEAGTLRFRNRVGKLGFFEFTGNRAISPQPARKRPHVATPFGRVRDSADYDVAWRHVVYGVYYGGNGAYLYQPIPKCACTTIKTLLLEMEGLPVDKDLWRRHQKDHNKFPGTSHLSEQEQRDIFEGRTDTFKFVIVRNPYARLASVYSDKLSRPDSHWSRLISEAAAEQETRLSHPVSFEEFVSVVSRQNLRKMDPHWRPQYYEGRFAVIHFDFVGHMEMMPGDLVHALERIGASESIIARANERYNVTGSDMAMWESVSSEVRKLFLKTFEVDFDGLHYPSRLPGVPHPA